jgi:glycosyltransferase involved in cell wall biosynthesis
MATVDIVLPVLDPGAIGTHTLALRDLLRSLGHDSTVYGGEVRDELAHEGELLAHRPHGSADDVTIYQVAIGNDVGDLVYQLPGTLVLNHHNITPPSFFEPWDVHIAAGLQRGVLQLANLATHAVMTLADSEFNAQECRDAGCKNVSVTPVLLEPDPAKADPATLARLRATPGSRWLFVGRVCPNKCQHDVITAFAAYKRAHDPDARLALVGVASPAAYGAAVIDHAARLGVADAVEITGFVTSSELVAHYEAADVFVGLSEHEGFCVPVLEAWHHGLPIVAFAEAAIPETLGGAGVLLPSKASPGFVAAAAARVVQDEALRARLAAAGRRRLAERFSPAVARRVMAEALTPVLPRVGR